MIMSKSCKTIFLLILIICLLINGNIHNAYAADNIKRLSGSDRYGTAVEISRDGWQQPAQNVVLATGEDFPDALCAAPLAKLLNAPILLSGKTALDINVESEIERLGAKNVFIIGGYGVISESIEEKLKSKGITVTRLYGNDRYETSLAVANYGGVKFGNEVFLATGEDFPDALSVAAIAAKKGVPIILSPKSVPHDGISKYMKDKGVTKTYIVGGPGVITEAVEKYYNNTERIFGKDRYDTNIQVINKFANELNFSITYLSTGNDYPDALSGSALAPHTSSPIILVDKVAESSVKELIESKIASINIVKVLGGEGVVPSSTLDAVIPKVVILSIDDITGEVNQGKSYALPQKVTALMSNSEVTELPVVWNPSNVDTSKPGVYTFKGTVEGYSKQVNLTLTVNEVHPIMGNSVVTAEKMAKFLEDNCPKDKKIQLNCTPLELAQMYLEEGSIEGVRGDVAFCQAIHETGFFTYGGLVLPEQNNYAGIGATNNSPVGKGAWFATPREGVRAQIQHLKAYASKEPLKQPCVDPRYDILVKNNLIGIAPNWEDLNGRWAVPGTTYGQSIIKLYERLKSYNE